jgi:hypothetical protein
MRDKNIDAAKQNQTFGQCKIRRLDSPSEELSVCGPVVGCPFEDVLGLLGVYEASDVADAGLPLDHH